MEMRIRGKKFSLDSQFVTVTSTALQLEKKRRILYRHSYTAMRSQLYFNFLLLFPLISCTFLNFVKSYPDRCTRNYQSGDEFESNSLRNDGQDAPLPPCVGPIEKQMEGRFRKGVRDSSPEMTSAPWLNSTLATIGQRFAARNWFGVNIGMIMAELVVSATPDTSHAIWPTGSADNAKKSIKRFTANILQDSVWYKQDLFSSDKANIFESLSHVKSMHLANIYKHSPKYNKRKENAKTYKIDQAVWGAFEKDIHNSNIPQSRRVIPAGGANYTEYYLNQFAMVSTLWGLAATPIIRSKQFGIPIGSDEELEGFLHFWAFVAHGVGVEDQFNVCLQPNIKEARIYFERFLNELLVPYLFHMEYEAKVLVEVAAKGFTEIIGPVAQFDFILRRMLEDVVRIPPKNLARKMGLMGKTIDILYRNIFKPVISVSKTATGLTNMIYEGYIQNLSKKIFGFDGSNKTIVAEKAFSW